MLVQCWPTVVGHYWPNIGSMSCVWRGVTTGQCKWPDDAVRISEAPFSQTSGQAHWFAWLTTPPPSLALSDPPLKGQFITFRFNLGQEWSPALVCGGPQHWSRTLSTRYQTNVVVMLGQRCIDIRLKPWLKILTTSLNNIAKKIQKLYSHPLNATNICCSRSTKDCNASPTLTLSVLGPTIESDV